MSLSNRLLLEMMAREVSINIVSNVIYVRVEETLIILQKRLKRVVLKNKSEQVLC